MGTTVFSIADLNAAIVAAHSATGPVTIDLGADIAAAYAAARRLTSSRMANISSTAACENTPSTPSGFTSV